MKERKAFCLLYPGVYLLFEATMVTTMEVEVEELWRKAVATTPSIRPQIGLLSKVLPPNASPAYRPETGSVIYGIETEGAIGSMCLFIIICMSLLLSSIKHRYHIDSSQIFGP